MKFLTMLTLSFMMQSFSAQAAKFNNINDKKTVENYKHNMISNVEDSEDIIVHNTIELLMQHRDSLGADTLYNLDRLMDNFDGASTFPN